MQDPEATSFSISDGMVRVECMLFGGRWLEVGGMRLGVRGGSWFRVWGFGFGFRI